MAFKPLNQSVSKEEFNDSSGDFDMSIQQVIQDGRLKLKGTPTVSPNPDLNWQEATWSETSAFRLFPSRAAPGSFWTYRATEPSATSDAAHGQFPFSETPLRSKQYLSVEKMAPFSGGTEAGRSRRMRDPQILDRNKTEGDTARTSSLGKKLKGYRRIDNIGAAVLKLEATSGTNYIQQNTSDSHSYWPTNVNNSTGWTTEFRIHVPDDGTSQMIFDDGHIHVGVHIDRMGILLETSAVNSGGTRVLNVPWEEGFQKVRIGAKGNGLFFLSEGGQGYAYTSHLEAIPSIAKDLKIGFLGTTVGSLLIDYFHQSHMGVFLDVEDDIYYNVSTAQQTTYTPPLHHARRVGSFRSVVVSTVGPYTGGTAKVRPQYKNTSNPTWTNFGSIITMENEVQEIQLSSVPVDSDGSDQIRFALMQTAYETSSRPPSFELLSVNTDFDSLSEFKMVPDHGDSKGGNNVRLIALNGNVFNSTPTVYVSGVAVSSSNVLYVNSGEIRVSNWPSGTAGDATVSVDTLGPELFYSDRPYRYVESYTKLADRAEAIARVCGTRSAFRVKDEVPNGEVNLAYLSTPGLEAESHVGVIDLSYLESGNIVGGSAQPVFLEGSTLVVPGSTFTYEAPPATEDLAIAIGAAGWRDLGIPSPLYYYHVIGKGRYYVRKEQEDLDLKELRESITVHYQDGTPVALEDFPWDICVVQKDIHGRTLPENDYLVMLLTNRKYIPGVSVFVTATVVDPSNKMALIQGYTEVVNSQPIYSLNTTGNMTYDMLISPHGDFTLNIRAK